MSRPVGDAVDYLILISSPATPLVPVPHIQLPPLSLSTLR